MTGFQRDGIAPPPFPPSVLVLVLGLVLIAAVAAAVAKLVNMDAAAAFE